MGDLKGHAIPGTFFLSYGLWWAISCLRRHLACERNGTQYVATSTYPLDCFQGRASRLPIEGFVKVVLSAAGMLGELLAHLPVPPIGIVQHATMYFFFLLSGVVDIAMHYGLAIPARTDYMSMVVALIVEGLLFLSHVHGRSELDIHLHMMLIYVVFLTAIVITLEAKFHHSSILALSRAYLLMLQGTWFWAVGIILYGHGEETHDAMNMESHESMMEEHDGMNTEGNGSMMEEHGVMNTDGHGSTVMQATIYFSWHCAAHFILIVALCMLLFYCCRGKRISSGTISTNASTNLRLNIKDGANDGIISDDDFVDA